MKAKVNLRNIYSYLLGNYRYKLYYSSYFQWLIRVHIKEQIDCRIRSMEKRCFTTGTCILCGCDTTALQMANKACDKPCYPSMLGRKKWESLRWNKLIIFDKATDKRWELINGYFHVG